MDKFYCDIQLSEHISKTPEGFLVCHDVPITMAGDMYYTPEQFASPITAKNGHVRVAKRLEDIHSDETIKSFEGKPITLGHPKDEAGNSFFVTPDNAMDLTRGVIQNVRPGSGLAFDKLLADFVIMDKKAIELVEEGKIREVSCGYNYDAANIQDGFFEQTNIRGNHVALVPRGRAGPQCAIFDSKEEIKNMSLKDKLKDALSVFSKAIDEAVPEELSKPMAEKVEKAEAVDESPMAQAMENMAFMNLDARLANLESMFADLTEKMKAVVFDKAVEAVTGEATDSLDEPVVEEKEETPPSQDEVCKAEILAPGISKAGGNMKRRALDECYKTEDGKQILDSLLEGKSFDEADNDVLFNAAASLLTAHRSASMKKASAYDESKKATNYRDVSVFNKKYVDMHKRLSMGDGK